MTIETMKGGCHCGRVRFEADLDLESGTGKCNCSLCSKTRNWSITIKPPAFRLLTSTDELTDYQFATHSTHNVFCKTCGVSSYSYGHVEEIGGDYVSIRVACLDDIPPQRLAALPVHFMNGLDNDWQHPPSATSYL